MSEADNIVIAGAEKSRAAGASLYCRVGKRFLDTCLAIAGLVITSPLFILCSIAIVVSSRGPVFFRQIRVGQLGLPFRILKFRTMVDRQDGPLLTAAGDPRITTLGKWLRKSKIDELPQFINVLRGEMSFVGPRPEVPEYVTTYNSLQRRVLEAKPGITGPASLYFYNEENLLARCKNNQEFYLTILMPCKLELDIAYCNDIHLTRDLWLIYQTVMKVVLRHNARSESCSLTNIKAG